MAKFGRPRTQRAECLVENCDRETHARGRCKTHYNQWLNERAEECSTEDCQGAAIAFDLCSACDQQKRRTGSTHRPNGRKQR